MLSHVSVMAEREEERLVYTRGDRSGEILCPGMYSAGGQCLWFVSVMPAHLARPELIR